MFYLLINPAPKGDESLAGYLHRLGHSNGLVNGEVIEFFKSSNDDDVYEWLNSEQRPISWQATVEELRNLPSPIRKHGRFLIPSTVLSVYCLIFIGVSYGI